MEVAIWPSNWLLWDPPVPQRRPSEHCSSGQGNCQTSGEPPEVSVLRLIKSQGVVHKRAEVGSLGRGSNRNLLHHRRRWFAHHSYRRPRPAACPKYYIHAVSEVTIVANYGPLGWNERSPLSRWAAKRSQTIGVTAVRMLLSSKRTSCG